MRLRRRASRKSPQRTAKTQTLGSPSPRRAARVPQEQCPYEIGDGDSPSGFFQTARRWFSERRSRSQLADRAEVGRISGLTLAAAAKLPCAAHTTARARARSDGDVVRRRELGMALGGVQPQDPPRLRIRRPAALQALRAAPRWVPTRDPSRAPRHDPGPTAPPRGFHNLTPPPLASTSSLTSYLSQSPTSRTSRVSPTRRSRATSSP